MSERNKHGEHIHTLAKIEGVEVNFDRLKFKYVTDEEEHLWVSRLAQEIFKYQERNTETGDQITSMVMVTMGGLLPGVLLHDHLAYGNPDGYPQIEFGTLGVKFYRGPGQPLNVPEVVRPLSIDVSGQVVGIGEDLEDSGRTGKFLRKLLIENYGARKTVLIAPLVRQMEREAGEEVIAFGVMPKDTWVITPRERVETMMKRLAHWQSEGASYGDCVNNLKVIGYSNDLIDQYVDQAWNQAMRTREG
jgi:hypoxanthine phosphoribosyltransferase